MPVRQLVYQQQSSSRKRLFLAEQLTPNMPGTSHQYRRSSSPSLASSSQSSTRTSTSSSAHEGGITGSSRSSTSSSSPEPATSDASDAKHTDGESAANFGFVPKSQKYLDLISMHPRMRQELHQLWESLRANSSRPAHEMLRLRSAYEDLSSWMRLIAEAARTLYKLGATHKQLNGRVIGLWEKVAGQKVEIERPRSENDGLRARVRQLEGGINRHIRQALGIGRGTVLESDVG